MHRRVWLNLGVTVVLLLAATFSSLVLGGLIGGTANAQMLFLLAVLLIARFTDGYLWGVGASIVSVPLVNYMFTYPYFSFNLTISGYLLTFLTMLAVSLIVSVLTPASSNRNRSAWMRSGRSYAPTCCAPYRMICARL